MEEREKEKQKHGVVRLVTELLPLGGFIDRRVRSGPIYPSCGVRHACCYSSEPACPILRCCTRPSLNPENPPRPPKMPKANYLD